MHRKQIKHYHEPGHLHELTFSCYRGLALLVNDDWRRRLARSLVLPWGPALLTKLGRMGHVQVGWRFRRRSVLRACVGEPGAKALRLMGGWSVSRLAKVDEEKHEKRLVFPKMPEDVARGVAGEGLTPRREDAKKREGIEFAREAWERRRWTRRKTRKTARFLRRWPKKLRVVDRR